MVGRATFTMVMSSPTMKRLMHEMSRTPILRLRLSSCGAIGASGSVYPPIRIVRRTNKVLPYGVRTNPEAAGFPDQAGERVLVQGKGSITARDPQVSGAVMDVVRRLERIEGITEI